MEKTGTQRNFRDLDKIDKDIENIIEIHQATMWKSGRQSFSEDCNRYADIKKPHRSEALFGFGSTLIR